MSVIDETLAANREYVAHFHQGHLPLPTGGILAFSDESIRKKLRDERAVDADHVAFLPFTDLEQSVRDDIAVYRRSPLPRQDVPVRGFVYDVKTGGLTEITTSNEEG